jgi:hypothetical protein
MCFPSLHDLVGIHNHLVPPLTSSKHSNNGSSFVSHCPAATTSEILSIQTEHLHLHENVILKLQRRTKGRRNV